MRISTMFPVVLLSLISSAAFLVAASQPQPFRRPLVFEPNRGQTSAQVKWLARGSGYQIFVTDDGITVKISEGAPEPSVVNSNPILHQSPEPVFAPQAVNYSLLQMQLSGGHSWQEMTGLDPTGGVSNYAGRDGKSTITNVPHYARLRVAGVYQGIDMVLYSRDGEL